MTIDNLLNRLNKVKQTSSDSFKAVCPSHEDKSPSLSIRALPDGRILMHCFAGCEVHSVLAAIGLEMSDLFPGRIGDFKRQSRPFPAADVLKTIGFEVMVVAYTGKKLIKEGRLSQDELDRLTLSVNRIQAGINIAGLGK
jgi:hypothetical protein